MSHIIKLSTKNFERASNLKGNDEFCFIIGKHQIYCHLFVAGFLSEKVSKMLISDPTINKYFFKIASGQENSEYEQKITNFLQKLIKGEEFEIIQDEINKMNEEMETISQTQNSIEYSKTLIYHYLALIEQLGNEEIKQQFFSFLFVNSNKNANNNDEVNKSTIEQKLKTYLNIEKLIRCFQNEFYQRENIMKISEKYLNEEYSKFIKDLASHFYEIDESLIIKMNSFLLNDVLSSSELKVKDEDTLLKILLNRRKLIIQKHNSIDEIDDEFFIEEVRFEFLSEEGIQNFLNEINFCDMNQEIWTSVSKRLSLPVEVKNKNERAFHQSSQSLQSSQLFTYNESNQFKGILNHLTEITNGNIHTNKTIEITCSKFCCGKFESLVDFNNESDYFHINISPSPRWLMIDFKSRKIQINAYLIKSRDSSNSLNRYLKSWKVEISDDGSKWEKIDEKNNNSQLNGYNKTQIFNVEMTKPFRFIRIITDKENHYNNNGFSLANLELYGNIIAQ